MTSIPRKGTRVEWIDAQGNRRAGTVHGEPRISVIHERGYLTSIYLSQIVAPDSRKDRE